MMQARDRLSHAHGQVFDLAGESDATLKLYGLERGRTDGFAWQCLIGRRLAERALTGLERTAREYRLIGRRVF